jgi:uncharacterized protein
MKIDDEKWKMIKDLFKKAGYSSMHCAISTVTPEGKPHVTPIGSLFLTKPSKGFYFEEYVVHMKKNIENNHRVCVMALNSSKWFWLKALIRGRFNEPCSIRLMGTAGVRRDATDKEYRLFQKIIGPVKWTRGYKLLWKNLKTVRDIRFDSYELVKAGKMTAHLDF